METLKPLEGEKSTNGFFACGREQSNYDGMLVKLPKNYSCDACVLQVEWKTKALGSIFMCADIQVLDGQVEDCSGQCTNGAVCMNGHCQCKKGYTGKFCEIQTYTPPKTDYNQYLRYLLMFILCAIAILVFVIGGRFLFTKSMELQESIRQRQLLAAQNQPAHVDEDDPDAIGGHGVLPQGGVSNYGQNAGLFN